MFKCFISNEINHGTEGKDEERKENKNGKEKRLLRIWI